MLKIVVKKRFLNKTAYLPITTIVCGCTPKGSKLLRILEDKSVECEKCLNVFKEETWDKLVTECREFYGKKPLKVFYASR